MRRKLFHDLWSCILWTFSCLNESYSELIPFSFPFFHPRGPRVGVCLAHGMGSKVCKKAGPSTEQQWTYCAHLYKKIHLCLTEFHIFIHLDSHNVERIRKYKWQWITKCKNASEHAHTHTTYAHKQTYGTVLYSTVRSLTYICKYVDK